MPGNITFQQYLQSAFTSGQWATDEVIGFVLPLFEEVLSFHENNKVAPFEQPGTPFINNNRLDIDEQQIHDPVSNTSSLNKLLEKHQEIRGYNITGKILVDDNVSNSQAMVTNMQVQANINEPFEHPVYLPGYQCYEIKAGHHDAQTDIFCLGLILASAVMGLDLYDVEDLQQFAEFRNQPAGLNPRIHPTVAALVTEMTELDRKQRSRDLYEIIQRLKHYRDYDPQKEADLSKLADLQNKKPADRRTFILSKLRNRLFDTSRRNRLLYYKPNGRFANLTVSSVPLVLHYQSINPQLLFTWNKEISEQIIKQKDISLNKYLRFEDHPYLNAQLNGIRQQCENDKKEYGFSQLKLVVAFLHWHNLKEFPEERIVSPLLLLPVELERKKSLKDERFTLKITDNVALINPVLAYHLKDLYGITLPESINLDDTSMQQFYELVKSYLDNAKQGVKLNLIDQPRIKLVLNIARQTINNYKKKLKLKGSPSFHQVDYSYSEDNYKPLGLELFRQKVEPQQSGLEFLLGNAPQPRKPENFSAPVNEPVAQNTFQLTDGENNPYSWDFDICNIVLGNFNYKKMSLVSDYNTLAENNIAHEVFNELFSNAPRQAEAPMQENDPAEWHHVITADPTQAKAILHSRTGKSYIIQGPPGTGKSQTITNLVADYLARGKTILFVCEKRAALDVVYHRLQQNQLAELCCYIHDSQEDKKEFIRDLRAIYGDFIKNRMDVDAIAEKRKQLLEQLLQKIGTLKTYHEQQKHSLPEAGTTTRNLLEILIGLKDHVPQLDAKNMEAAPAYSQWLQYGETIKQLGKALEETGADQQFSTHPFSNLGAAVIQAESPITLMDSLVQNAHSAIRNINEIIARNNIPREHAANLEHIKNLVQDSVLLEPLAQSNNLQLVNSTNTEAKAFEQTYRSYKETQNTYQQKLDINKKWLNRFDEQELPQALAIAQKHEPSFFKFFSGSWRRLKKQVNQSYDFSAHQMRPSVTDVLLQLQEEYAAKAMAVQSKASIEKQYHVDNIDTVYLGIDVLRRKQGDKEIDFLLQHPQSNTLVIEISKLNNAMRQLEAQLKQCLYTSDSKTLAQLTDELNTIQANADILKDLLPVLRRFSTLPEPVQQFIRSIPLTPLQAEAAMANKTVEVVFDRNREFANTSQTSIKETVDAIERLYKELLHINSEHIRAKCRQKFIERYELSNMSVTVLSPEQKILKKQYSDGRKILEHEMSKTMRYKSIREMASNDSGKVLRDIKPVWLMSPLSVSDSLPLDKNFFDVVIFDEASQITLEEGIPALFRAPQAIIVGDDKQMPPTNFFMSRSEDPEDLEIIEGESEDEILSADADSLLIQGARKLNSTMLCWHYRSRYETLISYSNHAFYEAGLLTIPDNTIYQSGQPLTEIQTPEEGAANAATLLGGSISFHYLPNSIYENRSNVGEAKYIASMIRRLLLDKVKETIGVVAFSQEQQGIIEEAIDQLAETDKAFEEALEQAYNRKDDGQFTGLFIKNLENVQGDERDIMIMSVCYGHDSNRKMLMNFGPVNRKGGEKRLNVIFSRAKKHMAVVSSIRSHNITNEHNDGANYLKKFLQYAEMVSTGNMSAARTILDTLILSEQKQKPTAAQAYSVTTQQIKKALEAKGYLVDEAIGQSSFKCTLGIKKQSTDEHYTLGILIDNQSHYQNNDLVEQYYQRPAILKSFGWNVLTVFAKDWLEDSNRVLDSIIKKLNGDASIPVTENKAQPVPPKPEAQKENTLQFTTLISADKERFWEVAQQQTQLHIRFGRAGTKGQVSIKTYASEAEAELAMKGLVEEQQKLDFSKK